MFSCFGVGEPSTVEYVEYDPLDKDTIIQIKAQGNELFNKEDYTSAVTEYTKALSYFMKRKTKSPELSSEMRIASLKTLSSLLSNRSAAFSHLRNYNEAAQDALQVQKLNPEWSKGYYRLGIALYGLRDFLQAERAFKKSIDLDPQDKVSYRKWLKSTYAQEDWGRGFVIHQLNVGKELCGKGCWDIEGILDYIKKNKLKLVAAILTHYHIDHAVCLQGIPPPPFDKYMVRVDGIAKLLSKSPGIKVYLHKDDLEGVVKANPEINTNLFTLVNDGFLFQLPIELNNETNVIKNNQKLEDDDTIQNDHLSESTLLDSIPNSTVFKMIHTPGHSPGSQCILINNTRLLTGDTVFPGSCGRVDFPDSSREKMAQSLLKVSKLSEDIVIFPGHDYNGEFSTIATEKITGFLTSSNVHF